MSEAAWVTLVERYADGRQLCNCRQAYREADGGCRYGCSANQIFTKHEIASRVLADLETISKETP